MKVQCIPLKILNQTKATICLTHRIGHLHRDLHQQIIIQVALQFQLHFNTNIFFSQFNGSMVILMFLLQQSEMHHHHGQLVLQPQWLEIHNIPMFAPMHHHRSTSLMIPSIRVIAEVYFHFLQ